jgi:branched-chain amino acid transport system permease protein
VGATYALVGLGFWIIHTACGVINFAQGEFVMLGGMATAAFLGLGVPLPVAILLALAVAVAAGLLLERLAVEPARDGSVVTLIIITIGASIFFRGVVQVVLDKGFHALPAFSGDTPILLGGAAVMPQSLWVVGVTAAVVLALWLFFEHTLRGKAVRAAAANLLAARLCGIRVRAILFLSFGMSALLGAIAGVLIAPISATYYEVGIMLGLKGFCAAILGGLRTGWGPVAGGLALGVIEAMGAGYVASSYKDAIAFVIILLVLVFLPNGLIGRGARSERV